MLSDISARLTGAFLAAASMLLVWSIHRSRSRLEKSLGGWFDTAMLAVSIIVPGLIIVGIILVMRGSPEHSYAYIHAN